MNALELHGHMARFLLGDSLSDEASLAVMLLFHTHCILFSMPVLADRPGTMRLSAITRRHAAESVACAWIGVDEMKAMPQYWFSLYEREVPYEVLEDVPLVWGEKIEEMRVKLCNHSWVDRVIAED